MASKSIPAADHLAPRNAPKTVQAGHQKVLGEGRRERFGGESTRAFLDRFWNVLGEGRRERLWTVFQVPWGPQSLAVPSIPGLRFRNLRWENPLDTAQDPVIQARHPDVQTWKIKILAKF